MRYRRRSSRYGRRRSPGRRRSMRRGLRPVRIGYRF